MLVLLFPGEAGQQALDQEAKSSSAVGGIERKSTRTWAQDSGYDAVKLFNKVSHQSIMLY